jgi:DNA-binding NtrC family response regulator
MTRARILVVDDKETFLGLFRRIAPADVEVVCASDGKRAMDLLGSEPFDVVVSDIRMPGLDGLTMLKRIRESGIDVEVILMTAYGTIPDAVRAMKDGAADYLTKPFDPDDAVAAIEQALARRRDRGALPSEIRGSDATPSTPQPNIASLPYREAIAAERERATREYLIALLRDVNGSVTQAAERAGIERESFHRLMKRHNVRAEDYRSK